MAVRISRRAFNASLLALGLGTSLPGNIRAEQTGGFLSTGYDKIRARHLISRLGPDLDIRWDLALPARGHDAAVHPHLDEGIVVARRPGSFAVVFGLERGEKRRHLTPARGRHFYGHTVYSPDGRTMWMTENDFESGRGVIGVYDVTAGYKRIGEFSSGGTGPHELLMKDDGRTLAVANGGIRTHPDSGRVKLNIGSMRPSLAYIDTADGKLTGEVYFDNSRMQKLSIRHMALLPGGRIAVGCQDQINDGVRLPLVHIHDGGDGTPFKAISVPEEMLARFNGYCGSVVAAPDSNVLAVSSPVGGIIGFWSISHQNWRGHIDLADGCGLAMSREGVVASSGSGQLEGLTPMKTGGAMIAAHARRHTFRQWDNHMLALSI